MAAWEIQGRDAFSTTAVGGLTEGGTWMQAPFTVNIAGGQAQIATGGAIPAWVWLAGGAALLLLLWKRRK